MWLAAVLFMDGVGTQRFFVAASLPRLPFFRRRHLFLKTNPEGSGKACRRLLNFFILCFQYGDNE